MPQTTSGEAGARASRTRGWEHLPHGADVAVRGYGPTLAAAFEEAALAMTAAITDPATVKPETPVEIACENSDREILFVEWLDALIYEMATRHMLFGRFDVAIEDGKLRATAWGEAIDIARHEPAAEIKGATLTWLEVAQGPDGQWSAQCVVDV